MDKVAPAALHWRDADVGVNVHRGTGAGSAAAAFWNAVETSVTAAARANTAREAEELSGDLFRRPSSWQEALLTNRRALSVTRALVRENIIPAGAYDPTDPALGERMRFLTGVIERHLPREATAAHVLEAVTIVREQMAWALQREECTPQVLDAIDAACADLAAELMERLEARAEKGKAPEPRPPHRGADEAPPHGGEAPGSAHGPEAPAEAKKPAPRVGDPMLDDLLRLLIELLLGNGIDPDDPLAKKLIEAIAARLKQMLGRNASPEKVRELLGKVSEALTAKLGGEGSEGAAVVQDIVARLESELAWEPVTVTDEERQGKVAVA